MQFNHRALLGAYAILILAACGSSDETSSGSGSTAQSAVSSGTNGNPSQADTPNKPAASVSTPVPSANVPAPAKSTGTSATTPASTALVNTIENLGNAPASQAATGLGFNVEPSNDWEFQTAAAAGATWVRFQCGWSAVETQTAPPANTNSNTRFVLNSGCQAGLVSARKYGLKPTLIAAFGSPFHAILQVSVPSGAVAGSTVLNVALISGVGGDSLSNIAFPNNTIIATSGPKNITLMHSYAGALVTGVTLTSSTTATLTLASALTANLPASSSVAYTINEYLHAPAASFSPTDPSNIAFAAYAEFLAQSIVNAGLQGEVELWNEPPWFDDPWDNRADFYDDPAATSVPSAANFGFVAAIQARGINFNGVTFVWGGTEKSGGNSLFNFMQPFTGVALAQPTQSVAAESMHPYGNTPEDELWIESCLKATVLVPAASLPFGPCNLIADGSNAAMGEQFSLRQQAANATWGVRREITETGFATSNGDDLHKARFVTRQFLGYEAAGVTPLEFYRLFDSNSSGFGFVSSTASANGTYAPNAAYTAISGLISDLKSISAQAPVVAQVTLPQVTQYSGTYPLDTVTFLGAKSGASNDSYLMTLWQRSHGDKWGTLASPAAGAVTVSIPQNTTVSSVINVDTRTAVPYSITGRSLVLQVADDPVEILLIPAT